MSRLLFGTHAVQSALQARRVEVIFVLDTELKRLGLLLAAAKQANVQVSERSRSELDALAHGAQHQGVCAVVGEFQYVSVPHILAAAQASGRVPLVLVLDGIQDPQNLGALVRSAHVFGCDGVIVPRDRAAHVTPAAVKSSAGATEHMRIARCTNVARTLEELKEAGLWIAGSEVASSQPPWKCDLKVPLALVLGAEAAGIRPLVLKGCDMRLCIPMQGQVGSLNVAAAGAALLYEVLRQRLAK